MAVVKRLVASLVALVACGSPGEEATDSREGGMDPSLEPADLCARGPGGVCIFAGATVRGLSDLVTAFDFDTAEDNIVFLAHSTALFGDKVSPINPRLIMVRAGTGAFSLSNAASRRSRSSAQPASSSS